MKIAADFKSFFSHNLAPKKTNIKGGSEGYFGNGQQMRTIKEIIDKNYTSFKMYKPSIDFKAERSLLKDFCEHATQLNNVLQNHKNEGLDDIRYLITQNIIAVITECAELNQTTNQYEFTRYGDALPIVMLSEIRKQYDNSNNTESTIDYNAVLNGCKNNPTIKNTCNRLNEIVLDMHRKIFNLEEINTLSSIIASIADSKPQNSNPRSNERSKYAYHNYSDHNQYNNNTEVEIKPEVNLHPIFNNWTTLAPLEKKNLIIQQLNEFANQDEYKTKSNTHEDKRILTDKINLMEFKSTPKAEAEVLEPKEQNRFAQKELTKQLHPDKIKLSEGSSVHTFANDFYIHILDKVK